MLFPHITIQLCTYNRYKEANETVSALVDNLIYPQDKVTLLVCDDSSPGKYLSRLERLKAFKHWDAKFLSTKENSGWGANVNNGLRNIETDYVFFVEDDYVLKEELDLRVGVALLEAKTNVGMVRYRGTAGGRFVMHQFEADISAHLPDFTHGASANVPGRVTYMQLDYGSHDLWLYSHGPHLKHRRFHSYYDLYPEGLKLGETEERYAHNVRDRMRIDHSQGITILPEWIPMQWEHIGKSYQGSDHDR